MSGSATLGGKSDDAKFKQIGSRPIRHDGLDKVTGRARFGADYALPGMLQGIFVRSPHAHARILSIDTTKAEKVPGVRAVITAADLPDVPHVANQDATGLARHRPADQLEQSSGDIDSARGLQCQDGTAGCECAMAGASQ